MLLFTPQDAKKAAMIRACRMIPAGASIQPDVMDQTFTGIADVKVVP